MIRLVPQAKVCALAVVCLFTAGCPGGGGLTPTLAVNPLAISFGTASVERPLIIFNSGDPGTEFTWTAREVRRIGEPAENLWTASDIPFLTLEPNTATDGTVTGEDRIEGTTSTEIDQINLIANRTGLASRDYTDIGIEIQSSAGIQVVPVSLKVIQALSVTPTVPLLIQPNLNSETFTIRNNGSLPLSYRVDALSDPDDLGSIIPLPEYVDRIPPGSIPAGSSKPIVVTIDRTGLDPAQYTTYLLIRTEVGSPATNGGTAVVEVIFGVGGVGVFEVTPDNITETVNIFGSTEPRDIQSITISNPGTQPLTFALKFEEASDDLLGEPAELPSFISIVPTSGTVAAGRDLDLKVTLDPTGLSEETRVDINVIIEAEGLGSDTVRLQVSSELGPRLSIQQEPPFRTFGSLDFGRDKDILTIGVGNTGRVGQSLKFRLQNAKPSSLIILPGLATGESTANECLFSEYISCHDWQQFSVAIRRSAINPASDVDGGSFEIVAVDDAGAELEGIDPISVSVKVERAPLRVEGATNRSRPPSVMRFVFMLRDSLLKTVDTLDRDVMRSLQFDIEENELPLELDETNFFVQGPENLVHNIVILLDFTGSMFNAGTEESPPVAQGVRIEAMRKAVVDFIEHLAEIDHPENFRIAIHEYHEQDQISNVIHPFSTSTDSLAGALENFTLAPADHGESEIFDALDDAVTALDGQDAGVISFDEADVRSIIFVSDGNDTSSALDISAVIDHANEKRVRLYPVSYGDNANLGNLIPMASETGGSTYSVLGTSTLASFFGTADKEGDIWYDLQRQLALTYISLADGETTYNITVSLADNVSGQFERDATVFTGDSRAGQLSLLTGGNTATADANGIAEVIVRLDYAPRNISQFRLRFIIPPEYRANLLIPADPGPGFVDDAVLLSASDDDGLLSGWHMAPEGDNVYSLVTFPDNPLPFGAFGNMMRLTFHGLTPGDEFEVGFRVDNTLYQQADPNSSVNTKFFVYPGAHTNPEGVLAVTKNPGIAGPGESIAALQDTSFNPEAVFAYDRDKDGLFDFDDPFPDDKDAPGAMIDPAFLTVPVGAVAGTVLLTNNRLDTLSWEVDLDPSSPTGPSGPLFDALTLPEGVERVRFSPNSSVLEPGHSVEIAVTIDRAGLPAGVIFGDVGILTNLTVDPVALRLNVVK